MARYHVGEDGQPRICTASSPESCPRAQKDENGKIINHFDSEAEANRYGEKIVADGVKNAGGLKSLSKNPLDAMAKHAPDDAPDDPATRAALGALAMRGCTLEKREDGRYEITGVDDDAMSGLVADRGTFVDGAEVNDDGSVSIGITMNGSIPHWGAEGGHSSWGGADVNLEVTGDLLLRKNDDGEYVLTSDNDDDVSSRISFDPRETVEDFKSGVNDIDDLDEDDDEGWIEANDEAIRENLSGLSADKCDYYFGAGASEWIQGSDVAVEAGEFEADARESEARTQARKERVARNTNTPADVLSKLSADSDEHARYRVAENPSTPADVLTKLSTDPDEHVRRTVADNPNTPADVLTRMSTDPNSDVRSWVARNPNTPASALAKMSTDSNEYVRDEVASHPNTPASVLARMSEDSVDSVRHRAARNRNTPADVLTRMSTDSDEYVRRAVACNSSTPASVLARMSTDSDYDVRERVAGNPSTSVDVLAKMSTNSDRHVRYRVAKNPSAPADALARMSTDSSIDVREYVAGNPSTPADSLIKLATESDRDIRLEVAGNPNTPLNVVEKLAHDKAAHVRRKALERLEARRPKNS